MLPWYASPTEVPSFQAAFWIYRWQRRAKSTFTSPDVAEVKIEVMQAPAPLESGGKWAVQIGGFPHEHDASELVDHLTRRYHTAKVLRFNSPTGDWWVRVRVLADDRARAQEVAAETETREGAVFLVRLD